MWVMVDQNFLSRYSEKKSGPSRERNSLLLLPLECTIRLRYIGLKKRVCTEVLDNSVDKD